MAVVARTWEHALADLGFAVVGIAGSGTTQRIIPGLAWPAPEPMPTRTGTLAAFENAVADIDLVIVENLCSLPLSPQASSVVAEVLAGRPAILHHHDLAWQRRELAHLTNMPPDDPAWRHVTLNELSRRQLAERGIHAETIVNAFDVDEAPGRRNRTRMLLGIDAEERVVLHPVRAIERKGIPVALALAEALRATYWITGPAEDGYGPVLAQILDSAKCRVLHTPAPTDMADAYAACDLVAFPSTWEGFGNPLIEAAIHRRPLAVEQYPVASEIAALGFRWFGPTDVEEIDRFLTLGSSSEEVVAFHDHNAALARSHFSYDQMRRKLATLVSTMGFGVHRWNTRVRTLE